MMSKVGNRRLEVGNRKFNTKNRIQKQLPVGAGFQARPENQQTKTNVTCLGTARRAQIK